MGEQVSIAILKLKKTRDREKESYKAQEVGSSVQRFVKKVSECPRIFNLEERNE